jgi:hypothetical protein
MVWASSPVALLAMINLYPTNYKIDEQGLRGLNDGQRDVLQNYLDQRITKHS